VVGSIIQSMKRFAAQTVLKRKQISPSGWPNPSYKSIYQPEHLVE